MACLRALGWVSSVFMLAACPSSGGGGGTSDDTGTGTDSNEGTGADGVATLPPGGDTAGNGDADGDSDTTTTIDTTGPNTATEGGSTEGGSTAGDSTSANDSSTGPGGSSGEETSTGPATGSDGGMTGSTDSGSTDGGSSPGSSSSDTGDGPCVQSLCGTTLYECGDCIDNDGDGDVDEDDVECISPCDDDESSFATGIPGDNVDLCHQDCFFDGNSGSGNDGCEWNLGCDPLDPTNGECIVPPSTDCSAPQPEECLENCSVPNGCDCFGCCTVVVGGVSYDIVIGSEDCSIEQFENCLECTKVESCENPCDPDDCELCFGEDELPPGCEEPSCPGTQTPCVSDVECLETEYCQTGCCIPELS